MTSLTDAISELGGDFSALSVPDRLNLLLEFSENLPEIPTRLAEHPDLLERVVECQSPIFLLVEIDNGRVHLHFTAPAEAPTTRGFASILFSLLNGRTVQEVIAAPDNIPDMLSLGEAVSPLRLRGMRGMLHRIRRQTAEKSA